MKKQPVTSGKITALYCRLSRDNGSDECRIIRAFFFRLGDFFIHLRQTVRHEKLKDIEMRRFIENAFRVGEIKTTGTDIDAIMPPTSRFGGGNRAAKKQGIIEKLKHFFERFFGIG